MSELAEALRSLDDTRKQKNDVSRELKELKYAGVGAWWAELVPLSSQGKAPHVQALAICPFSLSYYQSVEWVQILLPC